MRRSDYFKIALTAMADYRNVMRSHVFDGKLTPKQIAQLDQEFERLYTEFGDFELSVREELASNEYEQIEAKTTN